MNCPKCDKSARFYGSPDPDRKMIGCSCDTCGLLVNDGHGWTNYFLGGIYDAHDALQDLRACFNLDPVREVKEIAEIEFKFRITGKFEFGPSLLGE